MANRDEQFVTIEGFPNYSVSNRGKVMTYQNDKDGKLLKPQKDAQGYLHVRLYDGTADRGVYASGYAKPKLEKVHRLVSLHFLTKPDKDNYYEVNHKDGNKQNNDVTNLEWVTRQENIQHSWNIGLSKYELEGGRFRNARPVKILLRDGTVKYYGSQTEAAIVLGTHPISLMSKKKKGDKAIFGKYGYKVFGIDELPKGCKFEDTSGYMDEIRQYRKNNVERNKIWWSKK